MDRIFNSLQEAWTLIAEWAAGQALAQRVNAFLWFLFIGLILGQLGTIILVFNGWWSGGSLLLLIRERAAQGNFVLFSTALLASSAYFLIREYLYKETVEGRALKSFILLLAVVFMLLGTLTVSNVVSPSSLVPGGNSLTGAPLFSTGNELFHWIVYFCSIILSLIFWLIDDRDAASRFLSQLEKRAKGLSDTARRRSTVSGRVRI